MEPLLEKGMPEFERRVEPRNVIDGIALIRFGDRTSSCEIIDMNTRGLMALSPLKGDTPPILEDVTLDIVAARRVKGIIGFVIRLQAAALSRDAAVKVIVKFDELEMSNQIKKELSDLIIHKQS